MEEEMLQDQQPEPYVPRPAWQVWAARAGLAIFILGLVLYYLNIFGAVK